MIATRGAMRGPGAHGPRCARLSNAEKIVCTNRLNRVVTLPFEVE